MSYREYHDSPLWLQRFVGIDIFDDAYHLPRRQVRGSDILKLLPLMQYDLNDPNEKYEYIFVFAMAHYIVSQDFNNIGLLSDNNIDLPWLYEKLFMYYPDFEYTKDVLDYVLDDSRYVFTYDEKLEWRETIRTLEHRFSWSFADKKYRHRQLRNVAQG